MKLLKEEFGETTPKHRPVALLPTVTQHLRAQALRACSIKVRVEIIQISGTIIPEGKGHDKEGTLPGSPHPEKHACAFHK